jgi:hypothetical protein
MAPNFTINLTPAPRCSADAGYRERSAAGRSVMEDPTSARRVSECGKELAIATVPAFTSSGGVHIPTMIAACARMAGTYLFRSLPLTVGAAAPGDAVLSLAATEASPLLLRTCVGILKSLGTDIASEPSEPLGGEKNQPQKTFLETQAILDPLYVFEQMGGVGVPERMDMRQFVDSALLDGPPEGGLEARARDGTRARRDEVLRAAADRRGKQPLRRPVGAPVCAEHGQCVHGHGDVAVLPTFAVDVQESPSAVHIGDLEVGPFPQAQPADVERREARAVDRQPDVPRRRPTSSRLKITGSFFSRAGRTSPSSFHS